MVYTVLEVFPHYVSTKLNVYVERGSTSVIYDTVIYRARNILICKSIPKPLRFWRLMPPNIGDAFQEEIDYVCKVTALSWKMVKMYEKD